MISQSHCQCFLGLFNILFLALLIRKAVDDVSRGLAVFLLLSVNLVTAAVDLTNCPSWTKGQVRQSNLHFLMPGTLLDGLEECAV